MWHLARDMWHLTRDGWGEVNFSQNFSSIAFTLWKWRFVEDIFTSVLLGYFRVPENRTCGQKYYRIGPWTARKYIQVLEPDLKPPKNLRHLKSRTRNRLIIWVSSRTGHLARKPCTIRSFIIKILSQFKYFKANISKKIPHTGDTKCLDRCG